MTTKKPDVPETLYLPKRWWWHFTLASAPEHAPMQVAVYAFSHFVTVHPDGTTTKEGEE